MIIKSFITREDALVYPCEGEEFRYENGWPFLEIKKNGHTSKLINKNSILEMEVQPEETDNEIEEPTIDF